MRVEEKPSPTEPAVQAMDQIIRRAEMVAEVESVIAEELRHYEAGKRRSAGVL